MSKKIKPSVDLILFFLFGEKNKTRKIKIKVKRVGKSKKICK
jgi:hypothetical protein